MKSKADSCEFAKICCHSMAIFNHWFPTRTCCRSSDHKPTKTCRVCAPLFPALRRPKSGRTTSSRVNVMGFMNSVSDFYTIQTRGMKFVVFEKKAVTWGAPALQDPASWGRLGSRKEFIACKQASHNGGVTMDPCVVGRPPKRGGQACCRSVMLLAVISPLAKIHLQRSVGQVKALQYANELLRKPPISQLSQHCLSFMTDGL